MSSRTFMAITEMRSYFLASKLQRIDWLSLRVNTAGDLKLKLMLIYHSYNLRALRIILSILCLCSKNVTSKSGWWYFCLQHGLLNSLSPLLRPVFQSLSRAWLFVIPWTTTCQASPSFTVSQREAYCWDLPLRKRD